MSHETCPAAASSGSAVDTQEPRRSLGVAARRRGVESPSYEQGSTDLFLRWCAGDQKAGDRLVRQWDPVMRRYFARRFAGGEDDLVQRLWIAISEARVRFRGECGFSGFCAAIARNICHSEIRARYRAFVAFDALPDVLVAPTDPHAEMESVQEFERLRRGLERLPPRLFDAVDLYYYGRFSARQVAERIGVPEGTVRARLRRARAVLREVVDDSASVRHCEPRRRR